MRTCEHCGASNAEERSTCWRCWRSLPVVEDADNCRCPAEQQASIRPHAGEFTIGHLVAVDETRSSRVLLLLTAFLFLLLLAVMLYWYYTFPPRVGM